MKKSTLNKLRANLDKALEPPRATALPKDDNSEAIAQRYAVAEAITNARGTESRPSADSVPGAESRNIPVQNVPGLESAPRPEFVPRKGHLRLTNEFIYDIMPRLKPSDGYVLLYLVARTHGFRQTQVTVTLNSLAKACCISRSQARVNVNSLIQKGYLRHLGTDSSNRNPLLRGLILEVIQPILRGIESVRGVESLPGTDSTPIKVKERIKETLTQKDSVGVGSKFTLRQCRDYATYLSTTGQGITNPGGYATTIHRTGEADALIAAFLEPPDTSNVIDASQCSDCHGTGFYYPNGATGGVVKCKHPKLAQAK